MTESRRLLLGDCTLDLDSRVLSGPAGAHSLDPKDYSVLMHLVDEAPQVVSSEALLDRSWPNTVVGDNALQQVIARLRRAFGDNARAPRYIETLPRRGYRLLVPAGSPEAAASPPPDTRKWAAWGFVALAALLLLAYLLPKGETPEAAWPETYHLALRSESFTPNPDTGRALGVDLLSEIRSRLGARRMCPAGFCGPVAVYTPENEPALHELSTDLYVLQINVHRARSPIRLDAVLTKNDSSVVLWSVALDFAEPDIGIAEGDVAARFANSFVGIAAVDIRSTYRHIDPWVRGGSEAAVAAWLEGVRQLTLHEMGEPSSPETIYRHMEQSVVLDPQFFAGHISVAIGHSNRVLTGNWKDAAVNANNAIDQAARIRPLASLAIERQRGHVHRLLTWNYREAARISAGMIKTDMAEFAWTSHWELGTIHFREGRVAQALREFGVAHAAEKDQLTVPFLIDYASVLNWSGEYARALRILEQAKSLIGFGPIGWQLYLEEAWSLLELGREAEALQALDVAWHLGGRERGGVFAPMLLRLNQNDRARNALRESNTVDLAQAATAYLMLGDASRAFDLMRTAIAAHDNSAPINLRLHAWWRNHAGDPRYTALLAQLESEETNTSDYQRPEPRSAEP